MAKLTKTEVLHIAKLSKLNLSESEVNKFIPQLSSVVDYVGQLGEVDIIEIEPTAQVTGLENVFRSDEIKTTNGLSSDHALSGTDEVINGYFKVGAILTERSDK